MLFVVFIVLFLGRHALDKQNRSTISVINIVDKALYNTCIYYTIVINHHLNLIIVFEREKIKYYNLFLLN